MHQLSSLDSGCLYLESQKNPLHISGLYIFSNSTANSSSLTFDSLKEHIGNRIAVEPILKQRLLMVPMELDNPYWVDDQDFNLNLHLLKIGLPQPGDIDTLTQLARDIHQKPLDRSRPLWEIYYVDGLDRINSLTKGSFAIITKIHHTLIHTSSGEKLFASLLDFTAKPRKISVETEWQPEPLPSPLDMLFRNNNGTLKSPIKLGKLLLKSSQSAASSIAKRALANLSTTPSVDNIPASIFDTHLEGQQTFFGKQYDLDLIDQIKDQIPGIQHSDLVLAICSGALRSYLLEHTTESIPNLIALLPIAVKEPDPNKNNSSILSNASISGTLISLATQEADVLTRLQTIRDNYKATKLYPKTMPAQQLADYIPSIYLSMAAKLYSRWHFSEKHNSHFNLVINQVPGPTIPLYLSGSKLVEQYHLTPIFDGMGLVFNVCSYHGKLSISVMSSSQILPDMKSFFLHLEKSINDLNSALNRSMEAMSTSSTKAKTQADKKVSKAPRVAKRKTSNTKKKISSD